MKRQMKRETEPEGGGVYFLPKQSFWSFLALERIFELSYKIYRFFFFTRLVRVIEEVPRELFLQQALSKGSCQSWRLLAPLKLVGASFSALDSTDKQNRR